MALEKIKKGQEEAGSILELFKQTESPICEMPIKMSGITLCSEPPDPDLAIQSTRNHNDINHKNMNAMSKYPQLLVFVSSSMAKEDLKRLAQDLGKVGGKLVIRGLVEGDMGKTQAWLQGVQGEVLIDPLLYRKFKITRVPTFVLAEYPFGEVDEAVGYDELSGNVTLFYALETLSQKGSVKEAPAFLKTLKDSGR
jgi:type-F conjugative transfer system pilin assembly protein TrbC